MHQLYRLHNCRESSVQVAEVKRYKSATLQLQGTKRRVNTLSSVHKRWCHSVNWYRKIGNLAVEPDCIKQLWSNIAILQYWHVKRPECLMHVPEYAFFGQLHPTENLWSHCYDLIMYVHTCTWSWCMTHMHVHCSIVDGIQGWPGWCEAFKSMHLFIALVMGTDLGDWHNTLILNHNTVIGHGSVAQSIY